MYFNLRRVGVQGEISKMRRRATTRARLVNAKVVEIINSIFRGCAVSILQHTWLLVHNIHLQPTQSCLRSRHISLYWLKPHSEDWPHLNGPISACYTALGFWG